MGVHSRELRASFHVQSCAGLAGYVPHPDLPSIDLAVGRLLVGKTPIKNARFSHKQISWVQQSSQKFTSGLLFIEHGQHGAELHGRIYQGATAKDAVAHDVVGTVVKPAEYSLMLTRSEFDVGTDPAAVPSSEWHQGPILRCSFELPDDGHHLPTPKVELEGQDITAFTVVDLDPGSGDLMYTFTLDDGMEGFSYKAGSLRFNTRTLSPEGRGWLKQKVDSSVGYLCRAMALSVPPSNNADPHVAPWDEPSSDSSFSIQELLTLVPDESVHAAANDMLMRNLRWAMGQHPRQKKWLREVLGLEAPAIGDAEQLRIAEQDLSWYQDVFAIPYVTNLLQFYTGPKAPSNKLSELQAKKLNVHLQHDIPRTAGFQRQHHAISIEALKEVKPRLRDYIRHGGEAWAKRLYDELTTGSMFVQNVNRISAAAGQPHAMDAVNAFSTLLTALQPSGELAQKYYKAVFTGILVANIKNTRPSLQSRETLEAWLPEILKALLLKMANGEIDNAPVSAAQAQDAYDEMNKEGAAFVSAVANVFMAINNCKLVKFARLAEDGLSTVAREYPRLAFVGKSIMLIGWVYGLISTILTLVHGGMNQMDGLQKAQFATQCVQIGVMAFDAAEIGYEGILAIGESKVFTALKGCLNEKVVSGVKNAADEAIELKNVFENLSAEGDVSAAELAHLTEGAKAMDYETMASNHLSIIARNANAETSVLSKIWEGAKIVVKGVGAVAAILMAVWAGLSLFKGLSQKNKTQKMFESASFITNGIFALSIVAGLIWSSASWIPLVGGAIALIGVIFEIVRFFVHEESAPEHFMRTVGAPFTRHLFEAGRTRFMREVYWTDSNMVLFHDAVPHGVDICWEGGYGLVNMRFLDEAHNPIMPELQDSARHDGWISTDYRNYDMTEGLATAGALNGIQFSGSQKYGIVNVRLRTTESSPHWLNWMTTDEAGKHAEFSTPEFSPSPIQGIVLWREDGRGLTDVSVLYGDGQRTSYAFELRSGVRTTTCSFSEDKQPFGVEVLWRGGSGITNLRLLGKDRQVILPTAGGFSVEGHGAGWFTSNEGGTLLTSAVAESSLDGLQFSASEDYGIVNMRGHRTDAWAWEPWMTSDEDDKTEQPLSAQRVVKAFNDLVIWWSEDKGLMDASFAYVSAPA
ncbi:hypothetical protein Vafri_12775 [Volvox africanus]|uniref:Uncharacterized protein n=1 Tax=Volvox africanus TaxID=51714 RepID=A0A8J4BAU9_9CHLO|nr:hypothetical protein Vafri_12775 [Volvox africanus]